ncbi:hypothetical protein PG997_009866 [Apiospora hydei]|uniref:Stc1 domain-containing protein n=1 Tax=Apiospora hydei TaxID=1337664 RepID=A0ABR1VVD5_9PEZI
MAKGVTYVPKPPAKQQKARKSAGPIDEPDQAQTTQPTANTPYPDYVCLLNAERDCRDDKFACYNCMTLKDPFEFEVNQAGKVQRMDVVGHPEDTLRRVCIDCGIRIGLYQPGRVIHRKQGPCCWVCHCRRANEKVESLTANESLRCDGCGMTQSFSASTDSQNTIAPIYTSLPSGKRSQRLLISMHPGPLKCRRHLFHTFSVQLPSTCHRLINTQSWQVTQRNRRRVSGTIDKV